MKLKLFIFTVVFVFGTSFAFSQKYAYIDSDYILSKLQDYKEAKEKLDKLAEMWTAEIEERYKVLNEKKELFAREEVLLPKEERERRKAEIDKLEQETMDLQKMRFGVKGDYFQKRQQLVKPIQDKVFDALSEVASKKKYVFVFDKANQSNLVYADPKTDLSDDVLKELGIIVK